MQWLSMLWGITIVWSFSEETEQRLWLKRNTLANNTQEVICILKKPNFVSESPDACHISTQQSNKKKLFFMKTPIFNKENVFVIDLIFIKYA